MAKKKRKTNFFPAYKVYSIRPASRPLTGMIIGKIAEAGGAFLDAL